MKKLYVAMNNALAIVQERNGAWIPELQLVDHNPQCLALDHHHPETLYCGTFGQGIWQSNTAGTSWQRVGTDIIPEQVMSVAISAVERVNGHSVVYTGTEPSAIFRSVDGGKTWRDLASLRQLPSAPEWSFPPRPYTHHVRWITPDAIQAGRVFAAIETGALIRSLDGGETWEDRKADGPLDTHTLVMHHATPDRLYSAAGDGFMQEGRGFVESTTGGETWFRPDEGLKHHYLWSVATDPADPDTIIVSAAHGPQQAHDSTSAASTIYRRTHGEPWQQVQAGLPAEKGMLTCVLATNPDEANVFYAGNNKGIFRSTDAGEHWEELKINWPAQFEIGRIHALVIAEA